MKNGKVQMDEINADQDDENIGGIQEMESLFAGSSQSSLSGIFEDDGENYY